MASQNYQLNLKLTVNGGSAAPLTVSDVPPEIRASIIEDAVNAMIQVLDAATKAQTDRPSPSLAGVRGRPY